MINNPKTAVATCPSCGTKVYFEEMPEANQIISCPECRDTLEVISLSPLKLTWADDHEEYDDEEYDEEDWEEFEEDADYDEYEDDEDSYDYDD